MKKTANTNSNTAKTAVSATPSIIASDVKIEGNISTSGEMQLDGTIKGDLSCGGLVMGETGSVIGTIKADTISVRGSVKGEIRARIVRLEQSAEIEGDIYHESLSVEAGAKLTGQFTHTNSPTATTKEDSETPSFVKPTQAAE